VNLLELGSVPKLLIRMGVTGVHVAMSPSVAPGIPVPEDATPRSSGASPIKKHFSVNKSRSSCTAGPRRFLRYRLILI
jgi:hypothetical protein